MTTQKLLLQVSEVGELLSLNTDRVYELIREGALRAVKIPSRHGVEPRKLRVPYVEVARYVERIAAEQAPTGDR